ncbi:acyltransferase [Bradyrhizobium sp. CB1650]|uniref:acyltransferase family protein n=1 Tax=Bradyrhizobium sp. CB1650 TaxID=3039153 RepID=UPI0024360012|nr:acyltransferase [Bradyrhizobium sp. CB1650]WGD54936.1 acyltransferase [Bradyrhizobium sp. CB1650]
MRKVALPFDRMKHQTPNTHEGEQRAHRLSALDGLRAISIMLVLATHLLPLGPKALHLNSTAGPMGMSLFFTLSGYLIVSTLQSSGTLEFVIKRLARILPLSYLYILLVFAFFGLSGTALLFHLAFLVNYTPDQMLPVTAHLWSLCVEVHFYILVTVLVALGGRRTLLLVWPICAAITAVRIAGGVLIDVPTHLRMDEILAGACVATLPVRHFRHPTLSGLIWILAAGAWALTSHPDGGWLQYFRPYAAALVLWATIAQPSNRLLTLLGSRGLRYIAATSYALYIVHPLTANGWWNAGTVWERYLLKRPLGFIFTLVAAHLSTFYWERFWIERARSWTRAMRTKNGRAVGRTQNVAGT